VSHPAVYSEVLFWFVVVLTLLLVMFIGVVVRTHPGTADSPQPPELSAPVPPPPPRALFVRWPEAAVSAGAGGRSARAGYRPRHAGAVKPELMVAGRLQVPGGPPWEPAPKPPGLAARSTAPWLAAPGQVPRKAGACRELPPGPGPAPHAGSMFWAADMTGRAGAHRQAHRHGAHRAGISTGRERRSAGRTGRHRAGVH
jgi:hypothetical protein